MLCAFRRAHTFDPCVSVCPCLPSLLMSRESVCVMTKRTETDWTLRVNTEESKNCAVVYYAMLKYMHGVFVCEAYTNTQYKVALLGKYMLRHTCRSKKKECFGIVLCLL